MRNNEGHLVSFKSFITNFQFSNESIEHLSNFPYLRNLEIFSSTSFKESVANFSLLSNLRMLRIKFRQEIQDPELFKDLGLFSNLISLFLHSYYGFKNYKFDSFSLPYYIYFVFLLGLIILPPSFSNLSNLVYVWLTNFTFQGFQEEFSFHFLNHFIFEK